MSGSYKGTHIHKDTYPIDVGMPVFYMYKKKFWKSTCVFTTQMTPDSATSLTYSFETFEKMLHEYPHKDTYGLWRNNSNSFISWILKRLSVSFELPKNCMGR